MFPPRWTAAERLLVALALAAALCGGPAPWARADEVAAFLEKHGLRELLAVHLEQQVERAEAGQREPIIQRLAALYAELLESADDPARRAALAERSRRLLASAPEASQQHLRLALLRGEYRSAEKIAERHRVRLSDEEATAAATATLGTILPELASLEARIDDSIKLARRQLARAGGSQALLLTEQVERSEQVAAQCRFIRAWALYYQSWLNRRPDNARVAEKIFGELLDSQNPFLEPKDVSVDLRESEAVARTILGMALCKAITASTASALEWVELLEHERTHAPLRGEARSWKLAMLLERGEYRQAMELLREQQAQLGAEVPLTWLRLLAVHGLEAPPRNQEAKGMIAVAVTSLAARGELEQILDLAGRYGDEALGDSGFALRYVKGVMRYHDARAAHGEEESPASPSVREMYEEAVRHLETAMGEPDAGRYPAAAAGALRLVAWCRYYQGELVEARDAFRRAAEELESGDAADALWMAIVCQDRLARASNDASIRGELNGLITLFLERHPSSEHAPKLVLKLAVAADEATAAMIERLLAVPENSEVFPAARRQAAHMLYQMFRAASGPQRIAPGGQFLDVALDVIRRERPARDSNDALDVQGFLVTCRRVAEVALVEGIERTAAAIEAIEAIESLEAEGSIDPEPLRDEIEYRRLRLALLEGDAAAAAKQAERLFERGASSEWSALASRALFKHGVEERDAARSAGADDREALSYIIRFGERVLAALESESASASSASATTTYAAVADAALTVFERSGDRALGERALFLYRERLLSAHPDNGRFLRATALLSEQFDDPDRALQCWRNLVVGLPQDSEGWFEARYHLIALLAGSDPARAAAVMAQHKQLHPGYGPEPWGAKLRALDAALAAQAPAAPQAAGEGVP